MKKVKYLLVLALVLFVPFMVNVHADETEESEETTTLISNLNEKVNVYFFRGDGCPHCAEAEEFFAELDKDEEYSNYYELVDYEVWYNEENAELMQKVAKALKTEANGVPFIVIGDKCFSGYASSMDDEIKNAIKTTYDKLNAEEPEANIDVAKSVIDGTYEKESSKKQKNAIIPIVIVSAVAILTVIALIFFTKEK